MRRLTDHYLLVAGLSLLLLCPQAFATPSPCKTDGQITNSSGKVVNENRFTRAQSAQARSVTRDAIRPAVAIPPEVLNLQLRPPASKT